MQATTFTFSAMSSAPTMPQQTGAAGATAETAALSRLFGVSFAVFDGRNGEPVHLPDDLPRRDWSQRAALLRAV